MKTKILVAMALIVAIFTSCGKKAATETYTFTIDGDAVNNVSVFAPDGHDVEGIMFVPGTYNLYPKDDQVYIDVTLQLTQTFSFSSIKSVWLEPMDERNRTFVDDTFKPTISNEELLALLTGKNRTFNLTFSYTPANEEEKALLYENTATCWLTISVNN